MIKDIFLYYSYQPELLSRGNDYLRYTLQIVQKTNPEAVVHLVGNYDIRVEGVKFHLTDNCSSCNTEVLGRIYQHLSTKHYKFELSRILRWDAILNIARKENIERFACIDIDTVLLQDLSKLSFKRNVVEMPYKVKTVSGKAFLFAQPNIVLIWDRNILHDFIQFLIGSYVNRNSFIYTFNSFFLNNKEEIAIDQSLLWGEYIRQNIEKFTNLSSYKEIYCTGIDIEEGVDMENGIKKVEKKGDILYGNRKGVEERICSLHFHSKYSKEIVSFYSKYI